MSAAQIAPFASRLPGRALLAGAVALSAFDLYGQGIAPLVGLDRLAPIQLAQQVPGEAFGWPDLAAAHVLHYAVGLGLYPLGWLLVADPLRRRAGLGRLPAALGYGVALWVFAVYGVAHVLAGDAPFLGFSGITWSALLGLVIYAAAFAAVDRTLAPDPAS